MEISVPVDKKILHGHEAILFKLGLTNRKLIKYINILSHAYPEVTQLSESGSFFHSRLKLHKEKGCIFQDYSPQDPVSVYQEKNSC